MKPKELVRVIKKPGDEIQVHPIQHQVIAIPEPILEEIDKKTQKEEENEEEDNNDEVIDDDLGVPLEIMSAIEGVSLKVIIQKETLTCAELFMCCSCDQTIFVPNLNESNSNVEIMCKKCNNDSLKFGVLYRALPIFNHGTKELYICLNCNTLYSPLQIENEIMKSINK